MLERTYRAKHMEEALLRIKRELGPDAVILSSRAVRDVGFGGTVEVTAAPSETAFDQANSNGTASFDTRAAALDRKSVV